MSYKAIHKFAHISAQKVRPFADIIRGQYALEAVDALKFFPNRGARMLEKVLKSAIANAEDRHVADLESLVVIDARVDGGPRMINFANAWPGIVLQLVLIPPVVAALKKAKLMLNE